ncbi:MAG: Cysteine--tRNA ligase [Fimbriimonadaceae bacterium]|nr:Cysteine--tRNA ligase [Fimbriimonadaceae bacterium]
MTARDFLLHDTLSGRVKPLVPQEPGHLKFYTCGPTVYSYAHIGNFRSFLTADLVVKTARAIGWKVTWVTNITDVGHLTQDDMADASGEDKMERALRSKEGEQFHNVWELSEYYAERFKEDWARLNFSEPDIRPKATQHVREQILAAQTLIDNGHAYETPTGVYFAVASFPEYGKLSGNTRDKLLEGVRDGLVVDENKRDNADFAIWKKDDKHLMQWHSPFGWGFPGWHIECSVMARAYLGDTIDLHSGGEDNIFPHHECEIAQSESLTGKPFSNHWLHTRFLQVEGSKMSKRDGTFFTVRDLVDDRRIDPLALRWALMSVHFGKPLNFTLQTLEDAVKAVERFAECDRIVANGIQAGRSGDDALGHSLDQLYEESLDAMCDNLNTSVALAKAYEGTGHIFREAEAISVASAQAGKRFLDRINELLGIVRLESPAATSSARALVDVSMVEAAIERRAQAKAAKNFAEADAIRGELEALGIELRDTPDGTTWKVKSDI